VPTAVQRAVGFAHSSEKSGGFWAFAIKPALPRTMGAMSKTVRKAVFPAAGLGTRFLPATKASPKEMLPLVDKPLIQYGVEEVVDSGIGNIIIITGRGKAAIEDHFDISYELEQLLSSKNKTELLKAARDVSSLADISYVRQKQALGLGHAVHRAKELVGDEPFAVVLSDDIIASKTPCVKQLVDVHAQYDACVIALMEVPNDQISAYGVVDATPVEGSNNLFKIRNMVEKPKAADAPSNLAIIGRYVLTPDIFECVESIEPGSGGEIQLTDAMKYMLRSRPIYGLKFEGTRYDAGDKLGFLKATVEFALNREDLGPQFRQYLKTLSW
jgi:UTP--glucose-1-phosphate uridylyltransferase